MSERGETDSRSIGSSDKFRATAVRRNVVNHQTRGMMAQRRQLNMFTKGRTAGILESSRSQTEVSQILNVDQSGISRQWQRFKRTGDVTQQPVSGRPRVTTPRRDRYLVISVGLHRGGTERALGTALTVATGKRISRQTVYRRLNHGGLYARRPAVCIPLTSKRKRAHLTWSLKHWSVGEWVNGSNLHFFDTRSLTAQRYRDDVLEPYVCLFRGDVSPHFIFMDDNSPCHRAVLIDDFLERENIQRMSWPSNSSD
ncbi:transposable element Tcb2 transposase [Trichonephila clavipes]|nr:transposable element Tcb2 transposase [Trichonephila clavipes]